MCRMFNNLSNMFSVVKEEMLLMLPVVSSQYYVGFMMEYWAIAQMFLATAGSGLNKNLAFHSLVLYVIYIYIYVFGLSWGKW